MSFVYLLEVNFLKVKDLRDLIILDTDDKLISLLIKTLGVCLFLLDGVSYAGLVRGEFQMNNKKERRALMD
jgi:hypothetical protein